MSDTHAHTAKVQADVQTGNPHMPPGHVEGDRQAERPSGTRERPFSPILIAGGGALLIAVVVFALAA